MNLTEMSTEAMMNDLSCNTEVRLVRNAFRTPDGTILQSRYVHQYVEHTDKVSGEVYSTDGGLSYVHCSVNDVPAENLCVYTNATHLEQREAVHWGTYGRDGNESRRWVAVPRMSDDHIRNCLAHVPNLYPQIRAVFAQELEYRAAGELPSVEDTT